MQLEIRLLVDDLRCIMQEKVVLIYILSAAGCEPRSPEFPRTPDLPF